MPVRAAIYGCEGLTLTEAERRFFREVEPWGFILFARNVSTPGQVKRLTDELKAAKAEMNAAMSDMTPAETVRKKFELVQKKTLELQRLKFERSLKIREVLTTEQRKKLKTPTH